MIGKKTSKGPNKNQKQGGGGTLQDQDQIKTNATRSGDENNAVNASIKKCCTKILNEKYELDVNCSSKKALRMFHLTTHPDKIQHRTDLTDDEKTQFYEMYSTYTACDLSLLERRFNVSSGDDLDVYMRDHMFANFKMVTNNIFGLVELDQLIRKTIHLDAQYENDVQREIVSKIRSKFKSDFPEFSIWSIERTSMLDAGIRQVVSLLSTSVRKLADMVEQWDAKNWKQLTTRILQLTELVADVQGIMIEIARKHRVLYEGGGKQKSVRRHLTEKKVKQL
jgi:hypothetical protein